MKIYLGSDHGGFKLKHTLEEYLKSKGHDVLDLGVFNEDSMDYPDITREVCEKVLENHGGVGVVVCGTGIGVAMVANKIKGIRAALCTNEYMAEMARNHNDANVLCLGERVIGAGVAQNIVDKFLTTEFSKEERHARRLAKMESK